MNPAVNPDVSPDATENAPSLIDIVVVTYSPGQSLAHFLDSLAKATSAPTDVVLADNGSTDGSIESAATRPGVRIVHTGGNLGYGRAANAGVAVSSSAFVVVSNPDIVWQPDALDQLIAAAETWPKGGAFGPLINTPAGEIYPSARELPSLARGIGHALFGWWWPSNPWTAAYRRERGEPTEGPVGWLSGSCLLLRRSAFEQIGGFDPSYFMYFEDVDLGDRLGRAGWQNIYVPRAEVVHTGGHATSRDQAQMAVAHHRSAYHYLSGRYPGWQWLPVRLVIRAGLATRSMLARRLPAVAEAATPQRRSTKRSR
jgi:N-acetylglucosaminyl-diphospho-decaprenol L-rhamnosyltransferase